MYSSRTRIVALAASVALAVGGLGIASQPLSDKP